MAKVTPVMDRLARLQEKLKNIDLGAKGGFWSPKEGRNIIRILPEVGEMDYFYQQVGRHNMSPDGKKMVYCPAFISEGQLECPVCELVDQLYKAGDKGSRAMAGELRVRRAYWMNVIVRGQESDGPKLFTPGVNVFGDIVNIIKDPEYGDIVDPDDGMDIAVIREGTGLNTEYQVLPRKVAPLGDASQVKAWMAKRKDLTYGELSDDPEEDKELSQGKIVYILPYDRIVREYLDDVESADADEEEEDDDEPVVKKSAKPVTKPAKKVVVEEEDDEDEEPPVKKSAKAEVASRQARRSNRR